MQLPQIIELGRALGAAILTVTLASSAIAQTTRISRTETDFLNRVPAGEIGSLDDIRLRHNPTPTRPVDYEKVDKRVLTNLMKEAFDESGRLYSSLETDYRRYPQLRSLLSELNSLRVLTNRLNQDLTDGMKIESIVVDFREIDAAWRLFSHRAAQATGLSSVSKQSIERIDRLDREIGKLFQVQPSLDRRDLIQQLGVLENAIFNMSDELRRDASASTEMVQLASDARKLQQQITRIEDLVINENPYERIVSEYNRFESTWVVMLDKLRLLRSTSVERAVRRAVDADNQIHELLWIENSTSRAQLKQTADALIRDVDEFYNRTPLKLLLVFKNASGTLQVANDFYGMVQNFKDNLENNESDEQLIESYQYVEKQGTLFVRTFSQMKSQAAIVVIQEIEDGIAELRAELNLGGTVSQVDSRKLIPIAASLDNLSDQLDYDISKWMKTERPAYRSEVLAASAAFKKRTQRLHLMLDSEPTLPELQREADSLYKEWQAVYGFLGRCRTEDRANLSQVASEIRTDLLDLDGMVRL